MDEPPPARPALPGIFRAVTETVAPRAAGFDAAAWARAESIVADALAARPGGVQRQLRLFLRVLNLLPLPRYLRTFGGLSAERRLDVLRRLERSPLLLLRRGVWGVRTLAFMAVYAQPEVQRAVGYRADPRGWAARGGHSPAGRVASAGSPRADEAR